MIVLEYHSGNICAKIYDKRKTEGKSLLGFRQINLVLTQAIYNTCLTYLLIKQCRY